MKRKENLMTIHEISPNASPTKLENSQKFSWKEFITLTLAGLVGSIAAIPSVYPYIADTAAKTKIPAQLLVAEQIVQSAVYLFVAVGVGLLLSRKTGLGAPIIHGYLNGEQVGSKLRSQILPSVSLGVLGALVIKALDVWFFLPNMPGFTSAISQVSGWKGLLAAFYGGFTEEILSRLFILTLLAWILSWFSHTADKKPSPAAMWIAILGSAIFFGLGHLPATLMTNQFSIMLLAREVLLNGSFATIFGYLYWKRGLASSMMAHFSSDLIVHFVLPLLF